MNALETIAAAAIARLASLGTLQTYINPDLRGEGDEQPNKSITFFVDIPDLKSANKKEFEFAVEIVNYPDEKLIFWADTNEVSEAEWAEILDSATGEGE